MKVLLTILGSFLLAEFVGYWLHKLLHSGKIPWLSRSHMTHHLKDYGPKDKMRTQEYVNGSKDRPSFLGIGFEWLVPAGVVLALLVILMLLFGVPWYYQLLVIVSSSVWSWFMFNYIHDALHREDFWMLKVPILNMWFKRARRLHDIHHIHLTDDGRMNANYGICFFLMDKIFETFNKKPSKFNDKGYDAALERYKDILK